MSRFWNWVKSFFARKPKWAFRASGNSHQRRIANREKELVRLGELKEEVSKFSPTMAEIPFLVENFGLRFIAPAHSPADQRLLDRINYHLERLWGR